MTCSVARRVHLGLAATLLAAAAVSAGCFSDIFGSADGPAIARDTFEYDTEQAAVVRVRVFGKSGHVNVTAVAGSDSIRIRAALQVSAENPDEAAAGLTDLWVDIDQTTTELVVQTAQPSTFDSRDYVADYDIEVPPFVFVSILNVTGDITVNGVGGDLYIQNASGSITLNDTFGAASVQIGNGAIDAQVDLPLFATLYLSTGNGDVDLAIPEDASAELLATAGNGRVSISNLVITNAYQTNNAISGTLGDGLGYIRLASGNGSVALVGY